MSALNLISENPFRVLGVYADSSAKDRAANSSKLKAFLKVGKSLSFPADFAAILPAPTRTPESVAAAEAALALPADRLRRAQFWFLNAKPADAIAFNRLGRGDIAGATEVWAKIGHTSAVQNRLVCELIQGNLRSALAVAELIYGNDVRLHQFAEIIVPDAAGTDFEKLRNDFYETLCDAAGAENVLAAMPNSALRGRIRGQAAKPILDEIYALVAATKNERKCGVFSEAALAAGTRLMNSARPLLQKLRATAEESSSDFRLTADKVGLEVLQCAIEFFNKSDDDEAARRAMPLIKFAQATVTGTMARERCDENARIMQENLDALPPPGVAAQQRAVDAELKKYNDASQSERLLMARGLLERTKPHLQAMRAKLGASNPFYLQLSTEIVMAAAFPAYAIIKVAAETGKRPAANAVYILLYVWSYVDLMDSFDLEDDFKDDYRMMREMLERCHLAAKGISARNSREKQQETQNKVTCVVLAIIVVIILVIIAAS